jgi:hypothetical protein
MTSYLLGLDLGQTNDFTGLSQAATSGADSC